MRNIPITAGLFLSLSVALGALQWISQSSHEQRKHWPTEESYTTLPSPETARWFAAGYNQVSADITWSRLLVYYGQGTTGEGDFRYLSKFVQNIIALDPRFKKVYQWASYAVTVTEEHHISTKEKDILLSLKVLEGAMNEFPDEYEFFWLAGIRYFLDLKTNDPEKQRAYKEKGAEYLEMAMRKPDAPKDLATKAAAFRSKLGQKEQARENLLQMIMTTSDPEAQATMLASFKILSEEKGVGEELTMAVEKMHTLHKANLWQAPMDIFVLLGGPPDNQAIDFDSLATERDLFGSTQSKAIELFP